MKFVNRPDIEHGEEYAGHLLRFLQEQKASFGHDLIPNMDHIDHRALNERGIEIKALNYSDKNHYSLVYDYDWFIFSGCTDTDESGLETNKVTVTVHDNGDIEFDLSALGH